MADLIPKNRKKWKFVYF